MGLILEKNIGGDWHFIQPLTPIPACQRAAYLSATYGKRAGQFRIVEDARPQFTAAQDRAAAAAFIREMGPAPRVPSAASLILAKLAREGGAA